MSENKEDLLDALEDRWSFMAEAISELKKENASLKQSLEERGAELTGADSEVRTLRAQVERLEEEKSAVAARIQKLLGRFEQIEL